MGPWGPWPMGPWGMGGPINGEQFSDFEILSSGSVGGSMDVMDNHGFLKLTLPNYLHTLLTLDCRL